MKKQNYSFFVIALLTFAILVGFSITSINSDRDTANEFTSPTNSLEHYQSTLGTHPTSDDDAILWNRGELVSNPGAGFGGADASAITTPGTLFGSAGQGTPFRLADSFTIPPGESWRIDSIIFFSYQTGSTTTSTYTEARAMIWDGPGPDSTGSTIVMGDSTTNRMTSSYFSNIYRVTATTLTNNQRPIMRINANMGANVLSSGTYWVDAFFKGTLASGPWVPPRTLVGNPVTGNGKQKIATGYQPWVDANNPQGLPFIIYGEVQGGGPTYGNKFVDSLNGANDTNALKSRGYKVYYRGTGPQGTTATWFQGNGAVFPAFNGPATGYVAANFNAVTATNTIDNWLVLPALNIAAGDTLSFWERSTDAATWVDSMRVMYSATGDSTPEGSWVELGRFQNTNGPWNQRMYFAPNAGSMGRFALRYRVANGGPSGSNSDYIGVDYIRVSGLIVSIGNQSEITADQYALSQNYPNPFNPVTKINFAIPKSGFVSIKVYDVMGREVATLVNEDRTAGVHTIEFNAATLSSGTYFYSMQSGDFRQVKKMVVLK